MMKKVLALFLVMSLASLASAGLIYELDGTAAVDQATLATDGSLSLTLKFDQPMAGYTMSIDVTGDLTLDTSSVTFASGFFFGNGFVGTPTAIWARISGDNFMTAIQPDPVFSGLLINGSQGEILFKDLGGEVDTRVDVVPEPMTFALLGLGGLLIRRKK
jgi:hypothetical protein